MTDTPPKTEPSVYRPSAARRAAEVGLEAAALLLTAVAAGAFGIYAERRQIAHGLAEQYLSGLGIESAVSLDEVDAGGFTGRISLGPADDPDFTAERIEVALSLAAPGDGKPLRIEARAVRLVRPRLKLTWDGRRMSYGALDPLVEQALKQKSAGGGPAVLIEDGRLRLFTPDGLLRLRGDAALDKGRLTRLDATLRPAKLRGQGLLADLTGGTVSARVRGDSLRGEAVLDVDQLTGQGLDVEQAHTRLELAAPYPDSALNATGPVLLRAALKADALTAGAVQAAGAELNFTLDGAVAGNPQRGSLTGTLRGAGRGNSFSSPGAQGRDGAMTFDLESLRLTRDSSGLRLAGRGSAAATAGTLASGKTLLRTVSAKVRAASFDGAASNGTFAGAADLALDGTVGRLTQQALSIDRLKTSVSAPAWRFAFGADSTRGGGRFSGRADADTLTVALDGGPAKLGGLGLALTGQAGLENAGLVLAARGSASGHGAMTPGEARRLARTITGLGEQEPLAAAVSAALSDFRLNAPSLTLAARKGGASLALGAPVELAAASGGRITLSARGPAWRTDGEGAGGSFELAMDGGGLPKARLDAPSYVIDGDGGFDAQIALTAALDLPPAAGATVDAQGRVHAGGGAFSFAASRCVDLGAARVDLGDNDLERVKVGLCPRPDAPLITAASGGWRLAGRFERGQAAIPTASVGVDAGEGGFDLTGDGRGVRNGSLRIATVRVSDTAGSARFRPLAAGGRMGVSGGRWSGTLAVKDSKGDALGAVALRHDSATGEGSAEIDAGRIVFVQGGLQPGDLSPLANFTTPATGTVGFTGRFAWTRSDSTSAGELRADGLDFHSPAGAVSKLAAEVRLSSLSPLEAAPGQTLSIEQVGAAIPLQAIRLSFGLDADALRIESGTMDVAGGRVRLEPTVLPFDPKGVSTGALVFEAVQVGDLVAASSLADKVKLDAVVDGRLPFELSAQGLRFREGRLSARQPGRLSISRTVLSGVQTGAAAPATENAVQDFAYQAMENLAFDHLDATVNSLPAGRLGVLFHIQGRHDPAVAKEAYIPLSALVSGRAFDKPIPLPKGTPIDLTLDTSLNFDELVAAYRNIYQRHQSNPSGSGPVQAAPGDMGANGNRSGRR